MYEIEGRDFLGNPTTYTGADLPYGFPYAMNPVQAYGNLTCSAQPVFRSTPPNPQNGSLRVSRFGEVMVSPITTPPLLGSSSLTITTVARLGGFPTSMGYGVCTPFTLTTSAPALISTPLAVSSFGLFEFSGSSLCSAASPLQIAAGASSVSGFVRTNAGGPISFKDFNCFECLEFLPMNVSLFRAGGAPCTGVGFPCSAATECCSNGCDVGGNDTCF